MSDARVTLAELINSATEAMARNIRTCMPGKVTSFDASTQKANVQPLIYEVTEAEDESREAVKMPVIPGVPVQFLGAGGYRITVPVGEGTLGSLLFSHRSLDKWLSGQGDAVDPELDHAHSLADAIFIPGLLPFGAPLQSCPTDKMTIGRDDGTSLITLSSTSVTIDAQVSITLAGGTLPVARQTDQAGPYPIVGGNPKVLA